ncbi:MAG: acyl carrier protein [Paludibacteraceae bacterium]|nr:acyl carrier protein [Paludibacteraceae bacterium]
MEDKIMNILRVVLENNSLDTTCSQENCETWDSMHNLNLCFELEGEFDIMFEPEEMAAMKSYLDVVNIVKSKLSNNS